MKLKDLKSVFEADETAKENVEKPSSEQPVDKEQKDKAQAKIIPKKTNVVKKEATDGIGKESYNILNALKSKLNNLNSIFNIASIKIINNSFEIKFDSDNIFMKGNTNPLNKDEVLNYIKMSIISPLKYDPNNLTITPVFLGNILTIFLKSNIEKPTD